MKMKTRTTRMIIVDLRTLSQGLSLESLSLRYLICLLICLLICYNSKIPFAKVAGSSRKDEDHLDDDLLNNFICSLVCLYMRLLFCVILLPFFFFLIYTSSTTRTWGAY